jgi:hypothetical protein
MLKQSTNTLLIDEEYENRTHLIGRCTLLVGFLLTFLPPLILWFKYGVIPEPKSLLNGVISISTIMLPVSLIEVLTFSPMLGSAAMYISYLTGNITNVKIPSAVISMEAAEVKASTSEGDIISTIAIAGSVIASEIVIVMGVLLITPLSSKLNNPVIQPAFQQILPALFGALGAYYILKEWKLAVVPLTIAIILTKLTNLPTAITIPICVISSIIAGKILYNKGIIKEIK